MSLKKRFDIAEMVSVAMFTALAATIIALRVGANLEAAKPVFCAPQVHRFMAGNFYCDNTGISVVATCGDGKAAVYSVEP